MKRFIAVALTVGMLVASCSADSQDPGDEKDLTTPVDVKIIDDYTPSPPQLLDLEAEGTVSELTQARADNDGQLPRQVALDLLASVLGDIPDAEPRFTEISVHDGTMALNAVRTYWGQLTPEQVDAIQGLLAPQQEEASGSPKDTGLAFSSNGNEALLIALRPTQVDDMDTVRDLVDLAEAEIARHLGSLGVPIVVEIISGTTAYAFPQSEGVDVGDTGESFEQCVVQLPSSFSPSTVAHEVFHCFQYVINNRPTQDWIIEGSAEWVGARVGGVDSDIQGRFVDWLASVESLFAMDYDALGYYWTIETMGSDPWAVIVQMLDKRNVEAVAASGLSPSEVLRRMGSAKWRNSYSPVSVDAIWDFSATDVPLNGARGVVLVTPESPLSETPTRGPFGVAGPYEISLEGSFVDIDITADQGSLQFYDMDLITFDGGHNKRYCLTDASCACPVDGEELERGAETLAVSTQARGGGAMTYSITTEDDKAFPDGYWTGDLRMSISEVLDLPGGKLVADQLGGRFTLTVVDGLVTDGTYELSLAQHIEMPDGKADAIGTLIGSLVGCATAPQLVSHTLKIEGTITDKHGTKPLSINQGVGGAGGSLLVETVDEDAGIVTGRLPNEPYLDYMRSVGVGVNDFSISFTAVRS